MVKKLSLFKKILIGVLLGALVLLTASMNAFALAHQAASQNDNNMHIVQFASDAVNLRRYWSTYILDHTRTDNFGTYISNVPIVYEDEFSYIFSLTNNMSRYERDTRGERPTRDRATYGSLECDTYTSINSFKPETSEDGSRTTGSAGPSSICWFDPYTYKESLERIITHNQAVMDQLASNRTFDTKRWIGPPATGYWSDVETQELSEEAVERKIYQLSDKEVKLEELLANIQSDIQDMEAMEERTGLDCWLMCKKVDGEPAPYDNGMFVKNENGTKFFLPYIGEPLHRYKFEGKGDYWWMDVDIDGHIGEGNPEGGYTTYCTNNDTSAVLVYPVAFLKGTPKTLYAIKEMNNEGKIRLYDIDEWGRVTENADKTTYYNDNVLPKENKYNSSNVMDGGRSFLFKTKERGHPDSMSSPHGYCSHRPCTCDECSHSVVVADEPCAICRVQCNNPLTSNVFVDYSLRSSSISEGILVLGGDITNPKGGGQAIGFSPLSEYQNSTWGYVAGYGEGIIGNTGVEGETIDLNELNGNLAIRLRAENIGSVTGATQITKTINNFIFASKAFSTEEADSDYSMWFGNSVLNNITSGRQMYISGIMDWNNHPDFNRYFTTKGNDPFPEEDDNGNYYRTHIQYCSLELNIDGFYLDAGTETKICDTMLTCPGDGEHGSRSSAAVSVWNSLKSAVHSAWNGAKGNWYYMDPQNKLSESYQTAFEPSANILTVPATQGAHKCKGQLTLEDANDMEQINAIFDISDIIVLNAPFTGTMELEFTKFDGHAVCPAPATTAVELVKLDDVNIHYFTHEGGGYVQAGDASKIETREIEPLTFWASSVVGDDGTEKHRIYGTNDNARTVDGKDESEAKPAKNLSNTNSVCLSVLEREGGSVFWPFFAGKMLTPYRPDTYQTMFATTGPSRITQTVQCLVSNCIGSGDYAKDSVNFGIDIDTMWENHTDTINGLSNSGVLDANGNDKDVVVHPGQTIYLKDADDPASDADEVYIGITGYIPLYYPLDTRQSSPTQGTSGNPDDSLRYFHDRDISPFEFDAKGRSAYAAQFYPYRVDSVVEAVARFAKTVQYNLENSKLQLWVAPGIYRQGEEDKFMEKAQLVVGPNKQNFFEAPTTTETKHKYNLLSDPKYDVVDSNEDTKIKVELVTDLSVGYGNMVEGIKYYKIVNVPNETKAVVHSGSSRSASELKRVTNKARMLFSTTDYKPEDIFDYANADGSSVYQANQGSYYQNFWIDDKDLKPNGRKESMRILHERLQGEFKDAGRMDWYQMNAQTGWATNLVYSLDMTIGGDNVNIDILYDKLNGTDIAGDGELGGDTLTIPGIRPQADALPSVGMTGNTKGWYNEGVNDMGMAEFQLEFKVSFGGTAAGRGLTINPSLGGECLNTYDKRNWIDNGDSGSVRDAGSMDKKIRTAKLILSSFCDWNSTSKDPFDEDIIGLTGEEYNLYVDNNTPFLNMPGYMGSLFVMDKRPGSNKRLLSYKNNPIKVDIYTGEYSDPDLEYHYANLPVFGYFEDLLSSKFFYIDNVSVGGP